MKKLYRSKDDYKVAGICGGLGEYFSVDPVLFRVLFIFCIPLGGVGIFAYLVMWMMVPSHDAGQAEEALSRRLSLSVLDRKLGGVCGGLGEFFQLDPVFFRILFVLMAFAGGLGIIVYVILWLIIPKSREARQISDETSG